LPEPSAFKVGVVIEKLRRHKLPGINQIAAELIKTMDRTIRSEIYKFIKRNADCFISRPTMYRAVNSFHLGYKNQSVFYVSGTSRCSQTNTKHIYTVWAEHTIVKMFNLFSHPVTSRLKEVNSVWNKEELSEEWKESLSL
jgi:hypothetical protein